jgi:uncharacterized protein YbjT (DUF2867 family)
VKTALIAGATGLVGNELLKLLIASDEYETVYSVTRKPANLTSDKLKEFQIDFNDLDKLRLPSPPHHVFCTLGTTIKKAKTKENFRKVDYDYVVKLASLAKSLGTEKFLVVSSLGANAKSSIFYSRVKGEMENAIHDLNLPQTFVFRPSLLMGDRSEKRAGEKTAIAVYKVLDPLFIGKLKKYKGIRIEKVAKAMIETASKNDQKFQIIESDEIQKF